MDNGDNKQSGSEASKVPQRRAMSLPSWLDGRTIAILTGMVSLAAMIQTTQSRLGDDIHRLRDEMYGMRAELREEMHAMRGELRQDIGGARLELTGKIAKVRDELRTDIGKLRDELHTDIGQLDERLRVVEIDVAAIRTHLLGFDVRPPHDETQHEPS